MIHLAENHGRQYGIMRINEMKKKRKTKKKNRIVMEREKNFHTFHLLLLSGYCLPLSSSLYFHSILVSHQMIDWAILSGDNIMLIRYTNHHHHHHQ